MRKIILCILTTSFALSGISSIVSANDVRGNSDSKYQYSISKSGTTINTTVIDRATKSWESANPDDLFYNYNSTHDVALHDIAIKYVSGSTTRNIYLPTLLYSNFISVNWNYGKYGGTDLVTESANSYPLTQSSIKSKLGPNNTFSKLTFKPVSIIFYSDLKLWYEDWDSSTRLADSYALTSTEQRLFGTYSLDAKKISIKKVSTKKYRIRKKPITKNIKLKIVSNKKILPKSSNKKVVKVVSISKSKLKLKILKKGTSKITISTGDKRTNFKVKVTK